MNVATFIKWLEKQPQHLEVSVLEVESGYDSGGDEYTRTEAVCFDDPHVQSRQTTMSLILGVE